MSSGYVRVTKKVEIPVDIYIKVEATSDDVSMGLGETYNNFIMRNTDDLRMQIEKVSIDKDPPIDMVELIKEICSGDLKVYGTSKINTKGFIVKGVQIDENL